MAAPLPQQASTAFYLLTDSAMERDNDIQKHNATPDVNSSDDAAHSLCPFFDAFYNEGGSEAVKSITNLMPSPLNYYGIHCPSASWAGTTLDEDRSQRCLVKMTSL